MAQEIKNIVPLVVTDLTEGMFVSELDRPWLETPYLLQGFFIQSQQDIDELGQYCRYVFIDTRKGKPPPPHVQPIELENNNGNRVPEQRYQNSVPFEDELQSAEASHAEVANSMMQIMKDLKQGKQLSIPALDEIVRPMINSIVRNPDAYMWMSRMREKDSYSYKHSVRCSIFAITLGRQMGLPIKDLKELAMGAMLFDVGKTQLADEILLKPGKLTDYEYEEVKRHVNYGEEILKRTPNISNNIISMAQTHHERFLGQGYPRGLKGDEIPLFGQIAGMIDCYDAITSARPYAVAISAYDGVKTLYGWRNKEFHGVLIEQFIQAIGIYPAGTLVELSNGCVGVVIAQSRTRRLRPMLRVVLDQEKQPLQSFPTLDLMTEVTDKNGNALAIVKSLEPGAYGINPQELYL
ncbi:MAG TPA: hypothetical protein DCZ03_00505 [Gammaproteobacteria bacterium]|nr:hypothetical protein [Gammaproteobacteria bacterium]